MQGKTEYLTIDGKTKTLVEWSEEYGMNPSTVRGRLSKGADPLKALTAPIGTVFAPVPPKQTSAKTRDRCHKCTYRGYLDHARSKTQVYCEYLYWSGHKRPCPAEGCTAFKPGPYRQIRINPEFHVRRRA